MTQVSTNRLKIPNNWLPRPQQKAAMKAWIVDCVLVNDWIWHRRFGKDDCALHGTCVKAHQRIGNYCIMLPQEKQVREALWEQVNPHTGILRLEEAFPSCLRAKTNEQQMRITLKNGSKIVFAGSDNYKNKIGSSLAGIVWSEWALSDPSSYTFLAPMLKENGGWCVRQGTPRGENHAYRTYLSGIDSPKRFSQLLTIEDTGAREYLDLDEIRQEYYDIYDDWDIADAMVQQEYYCSFKVIMPGAVWGSKLAKLEAEGRIKKVPHDPNYPVHTAWDIGRSDSTAIWFYQEINDRLKIIDFVQNSQKDVDWYASQLLGKEVTINLIKDEIKVSYGEDIQEAKHRQDYTYETIGLPHDAKAQTLAAKKSVQQQLAAVFGYEQIKLVPRLSIDDGIKATRKALDVMEFDESCKDAFEILKQYRYRVDEETKMISDKPIHDWTSHTSDALRYLAVQYKTQAEPKKKPKKKKPKDQFIKGLELTAPKKKRKQW